MPNVRLSGTVLGPQDPGRALRAQLLSNLFEAGWDIQNSNGDQRITLCNIEEKIIQADAFVFTPGATLEDMFKAVSIFVGYQTLDRHLSSKPTVVMNADQSWDPFFAVLSHLERMETIKQRHADFLVSAASPEDVLKVLADRLNEGVPDAGREKIADRTIPAADTPIPSDYLGSVCVFCSASLEDPSYIADGEALGRMIAEANLGCVSGAGRSGIMGAVVRGSVGAGGWTAGSNVPHIIELEGLPDGLSQFWLRDDIYTRMEVMIEESDAFVIFPGGAGTFQELLALLIFKHQGHPTMKGKPVIVFNRKNGEGIGFWDPLIDLFDGLCEPGDFLVTEDLAEIVPTALRHLEQD